MAPTLADVTSDLILGRSFVQRNDFDLASRVARSIFCAAVCSVSGNPAKDRVTLYDSAFVTHFLTLSASFPLHHRGHLVLMSARFAPARVSRWKWRLGFIVCYYLSGYNDKHNNIKGAADLSSKLFSTFALLNAHKIVTLTRLTSFWYS